MKRFILLACIVVVVYGWNLRGNDEKEWPRSGDNDKPVANEKNPKKFNNVMLGFYKKRNPEHERGIVDKLKGKECKFYGQDCSVWSLSFCCGDLECKGNNWYSTSGQCRFDWE